MQRHVGNASACAQPSSALLLQLPVRTAAELAAAAAAIDYLSSRHTIADPSSNPNSDPSANVAELVPVHVPLLAAADGDREHTRKYTFTRLAFNLRLARRLLVDLHEHALLAASHLRVRSGPAHVQLDQLATADGNTRSRLDSFAAVVHHTRLNLRVYGTTGSTLIYSL